MTSNEENRSYIFCGKNNIEGSLVVFTKPSFNPERFRYLLTELSNLSTKIFRDISHFVVYAIDCEECSSSDVTQFTF